MGVNPMNLTEIDTELKAILKQAPILEKRTDQEGRWLLCMITKRYFALQKMKYKLYTDMLLK